MTLAGVFIACDAIKCIVNSVPKIQLFTGRKHIYSIGNDAIRSQIQQALSRPFVVDCVTQAAKTSAFCLGDG